MQVVPAGETSKCVSGLKCFETNSTSSLIEAINQLHGNGEITNYVHEECGDGWSMSYIAPPADCHRINTAMRDYLKYQGGVNCFFNTPDPFLSQI